ncbi:MAG: sulfotransferase, partial [Cyanobacteria bacterium J06632_3]
MANAPSFIIMGAMKCATTTLHEQLDAQPGVFMSELKEPNFFSDDDQYQKGMDWYLDLFAEAAPTDMCGESSTHYTKLPTFPNSVKRLEKHLPNVKLIYVMRHPVDRLVSQYIHEWSQKTVSGSLSQALKKRPELWQYSSYAMQLKPYLETFGAQNVLPVFFDRLKQFPQEELTRIGHFLGCEQPLVWQSATGHRHASKERLRESAWRDALVNAPGLKTIRKNLVPKSVRLWVKGLWQMKERPQLNDAEQAELEAKLNQDLALLGRWLGCE